MQPQKLSDEVEVALLTSSRPKGSAIVMKADKELE
jgi:hypothetical protein